MRRKLFLNLNVLTQNKKNPKATAFAVEDGKFIAVGAEEEILQLKNDETEIINLRSSQSEKNKLIALPGFNDAHIHIWKVGNLLTYMLDLRGVKSIEEMQEKLFEYNNNNPELDWIQARGFNEAFFTDGRIPNKNDINKVIKDKPVCIIRTCAHQIVVNSKALEIAEINNLTRSPHGGEIKFLPNGELAGHFTETAIGLVLNKIPKYTAEQYRKMILAAQDEFLKYGITSATDPAVAEDLLEVYKQMDKNGELKIRINAISIRVPDGTNKISTNPNLYNSDNLKINAVKFFADGGLSGKTAALKNFYKNSNEHGVLRLEKNLFKKLARESHDAGFRIATHAIGDDAIEMVLNVYKEISTQNKNNINHRIEHLGFPSRENLQLMKEFNISAVMQPIFIYELGKNFREYLPDDYLNFVYPAKSVLDSGVNLALSTDAPVVKNINPFLNIKSATDRKDFDGFEIASNQNINLDDALYAYTMGSAIANCDEKNIGSIEVGKFADFVVFDEKNFSDSQITNTHKVKSTYISGELMKS